MKLLGPTSPCRRICCRGWATHGMKRGLRSQLVLASILADVWLESGFETFDLIWVINGTERSTLFGAAR